MSIIINADDFGLNEHCSKAIAQAFKEGLITDTTMMATGEYFDEAVELAKEQGFIDKIGIHLNLTEGEPLTEEIKSCPRFVTDGRFNKQYNRSKPLTTDEKAAIYKELTAQVEKIQKAGITITHADSHHHIHTGIFIAPIAVKVCKEHGITKMRLHQNTYSKANINNDEAERFNRYIKSNGILTTDFFAYLNCIDYNDIPANIELLVHPDFDAENKLIDRQRIVEMKPFGLPIPRIHQLPYLTMKGYSYLS